jgi:Ca2+-binding EF-hand superfamily protein
MSTCIPVASEPWQVYDKNGNGKIETVELIKAIQDWLKQQAEHNGSDQSDTEVVAALNHFF